MAGTTGLEPAASAVTGQRSNQLNYVPTRQINELRNRQVFTRRCTDYIYCIKCLPVPNKKRSYWVNHSQTICQSPRKVSRAQNNQTTAVNSRSKENHAQIA